MNNSHPLKDVIEASNVSQAKIAREAGVSGSLLNIWLNHLDFPATCRTDKSREQWTWKIIHACQALKLPLQKPLTQYLVDCEGSEKLPRAYWYVKETGLRNGQLASLLGVLRQQNVWAYLHGHHPLKRRSTEFACFRAELPKFLTGRYPGINIDWEYLFTRISHEDYLGEREKLNYQEGNKVLTFKARKYYGFYNGTPGKPVDPFRTADGVTPEKAYISDWMKSEILEPTVEALQELSLVIVSGATGAGKTTLKSVVMDLLSRVPLSSRSEFFEVDELAEMPRIPEKDQKYKFIKIPELVAENLRGANILSVVVNSTGKEIGASLPLNEKENRFLKTIYEMEQTPVLIVDEANRRPKETLRNIKSLFELDRGTEQEDERFMSVLVLGQHGGSMSEIATSEMLREVKNRAVNNDLKDYSPREIEEYIAHRLSLVGKKTEEVFGVDALARIIERALRRGAVPTEINKVCTDALVEKFKIDPDPKQKKVEAAHVIGA